MSQIIHLKAEDTEPLILVVNANGLNNLSTVSSAVFYAREQTVTTNHVNGASLLVENSDLRRLSFDPVGAKNGGGNAFDTAGTYLCYVKVTFSDSDISRFPGRGYLTVNISPNFES